MSKFEKVLVDSIPKLASIVAEVTKELLNPDDVSKWKPPSGAIKIPDEVWDSPEEISQQRTDQWLRQHGIIAWGMLMTPSGNFVIYENEAGSRFTIKVKNRYLIPVSIAGVEKFAVSAKDYFALQPNKEHGSSGDA